MYDIAVIGGGINGCGIARDAAGRGYSVVLAEMGDLAQGTSSGSTKLIHGGLRYLEHFEFRLVRESLKERERLCAIAPHIVYPLRFVLPYHRGMRPAWLLRLGLFLYDHLGGRGRLPGTRVLDLRHEPAGRPLKPEFKKAFEYSDCWVDDARLVVLNARDAADRGAVIRTRMAVAAARREDDHWRLELRDARDGGTSDLRARLLVNAAGPWVDDVLGRVVGSNASRNVRLVQGSHIVVRRLFEHDSCYFFQNADGRIFFAIPFAEDFTLIGTTDRDYHGDPGAVAISDSETAYLCEAASQYFTQPVTPEQIVWTYSAVRPLFDDGASKAQEATRDYVLRQEGGPGEAPLLNIFGGKITTYRRLAELVMREIESHLGAQGPAWTGAAPLPGGDFPVDGYEEQVERLAAAYPFLEPRTARRLVRAYGTSAAVILDGAASMDDLGIHFGAGLTEREVEYLRRHEWAETAEDILWRRSKLGLRLSHEETERLTAWLGANGQSANAAPEDRPPRLDGQRSAS